MSELSQTLRPALPVDDPSRGDYALQILKASCNPEILSQKVKIPCTSQGDCNCLVCLSSQLAKLPVELFTTIILMDGLSYIPRLLTIFGETSKLNSDLTKRQPRHASLSCQGNVFQTSVKYGGKCYITGLYEEETSCSVKVKTKDTACDYLLVWSNRLDITKVQFVDAKGQVADNQPSFDAALKECRNCLHLEAKHSLTIKSSREWVFAVAVTEAPVVLKYKVSSYLEPLISPSYLV